MKSKLMDWIIVLTVIVMVLIVVLGIWIDKFHIVDTMTCFEGIGIEKCGAVGFNYLEINYAPYRFGCELGKYNQTFGYSKEDVDYCNRRWF